MVCFSHPGRPSSLSLFSLAAAALFFGDVMTGMLDDGDCTTKSALMCLA